MCTTEVEHLLCFSDAANIGSGDTATAHNKAKRRHWKRFCWRTNKGKIAIVVEQVQIGVYVVIGRDSVEDEVEAAIMFLHLVAVSGYNNFISAKAKSIFLLGGRGGKYNDRVCFFGVDDGVFG